MDQREQGDEHIGISVEGCPPLQTTRPGSSLGDRHEDQQAVIAGGHKFDSVGTQCRNRRPEVAPR